MARTLALFAFWLVLGCSSTSSPAMKDAAVEATTDAGGPQTDATPSCAHSDQCDPSDCVCGDGTSRQVTGAACADAGCVAPSVACAPICAQNGGLATSLPAPNVVGSPACSAFCAKALSLGCPQGTSCRPYYNCTVPTGGCTASVTAELGCQLEAGTWTCDPFGDWVVDSTCTGMFSAQCTADGGRD